MALGHDPLSTRPLSDVEATPLAQGGDPAPLPHLGLLLGSGGGTAFDLTPTAAVALSGALSTTGAIGYGIDLEAPLNLDVAGALSVSGALGLGIGVAQTAGPAMAGSLSLAGTFEFAGPFSLTPTGAVALAGAMSVAGDVQSSILFELTPSAALALSGSLTPAGAFGSDIGVGGSVSLAGALSAAGDTTYAIAFETGGNVTLGGALSVAGDLEILANQFTLIPTAALAMAGSMAVAGDVASSDAQEVNSGGWPIAAMVSEMRRRRAREAERLKALEEEERKREQALTIAKSQQATHKAKIRLDKAKDDTIRQERLLELLIAELADAMKRQAEEEEEREILEILAEWM